MKSLYFIGNDELWNDPLFRALTESLESQQVAVTLLDPSKDAGEIKKVVAVLTARMRIIFHRKLDPDQVFKELGIQLPFEVSSLIYKFSEIVNSSAMPRHVAWVADGYQVLRGIGLWEATHVVEEAFLFDLNLSEEISKAISIDKDSLVDANILTADAEQMSELMAGEFGAENVVASPAPIDHATRIEQLTTIDQATRLEAGGTAIEKLPSLEEISSAVAAMPPEQSESVLIKVEDIGDAPLSLADSKIDEMPSEEKSSIAVVSSMPMGVIEPQPDEAVPVQFSGSPAVEVSHLLSSISQSISGEDLEVLKRYSSIKERELREALASVEALRKQIRYFDERLKKSEEERRRLLLKIEETENELRTVADKKDENRAQLKNVEGRYEEKIKDLQIQLESSQFQAGKLDKKLIDFRERVRNDLQKIRSRERELASRLEIQKRDAEALLSAKDERLLNQKREMDRLEFELDSLKERLYEDAQKGEERRKRIARALQSLKLAQSVLSGLEEDVSTNDEKDNAA